MRQKEPNKPGTKELPPPNGDGAKPRERQSWRAYTDLEKESLGLALVRMVLASDDQRMVDLRAQHGVGADAVDELNQFFELKVSARDEPDTVTLEESQIRRAMTTPDFFLVVVSGLEGVGATPKVRVISDIGRLQMSKTSKVRFSGVHSAESLVFNLGSGGVPDPSDDQDTTFDGPELTDE